MSALLRLVVSPHLKKYLKVRNRLFTNMKNYDATNLVLWLINEPIKLYIAYYRFFNKKDRAYFLLLKGCYITIN
jgi:hypothetical protein